MGQIVTVIYLFYGIFSGNTGSAVGETAWEWPGYKFYHNIPFYAVIIDCPLLKKNCLVRTL